MPTESVPVNTIPLPQIIENARRVMAMLGLKISSVTAVSKVDGGGWRVTMELVERAAVPDSMDLLGVYELMLDEGGNVIGYERTRVRRRGELGRCSE